MKRSEAIATIKESLAGFTPDDDKCAGWIIDDLIRAGLRPPTFTAKDPGHFPGDSFEYQQEGWEDET